MISAVIMNLNISLKKCVESTANNHESPNPADGKKSLSPGGNTDRSLSLCGWNTALCTVHTLHNHPCTHAGTHACCISLCVQYMHVHTYTVLNCTLTFQININLFSCVQRHINDRTAHSHMHTCMHYCMSSLVLCDISGSQDFACMETHCSHPINHTDPWPNSEAFSLIM